VTPRNGCRTHRLSPRAFVLKDYARRCCRLVHSFSASLVHSFSASLGYSPLSADRRERLQRSVQMTSPCAPSSAHPVRERKLQVRKHTAWGESEPDLQVEVDGRVRCRGGACRRSRRVASRGLALRRFLQFVVYMRNVAYAHSTSHAHMRMHTARQTASHTDTGYLRKDTHTHTHTHQAGQIQLPQALYRPELLPHRRHPNTMPGWRRKG
jgi:hypothetical protein